MGQSQSKPLSQWMAAYLRWGDAAMLFLLLYARLTRVAMR